jgi:hypothetical protein
LPAIHRAGKPGYINALAGGVGSSERLSRKLEQPVSAVSKAAVASAFAKRAAPTLGDPFTSSDLDGRTMKLHGSLLVVPQLR